MTLINIVWWQPLMCFCDPWTTTCDSQIVTLAAQTERCASICPPWVSWYYLCGCRRSWTVKCCHMPPAFLTFLSGCSGFRNAAQWQHPENRPTAAALTLEQRIHLWKRFNVWWGLQLVMWTLSDSSSLRGNTQFNSLVGRQRNRQTESWVWIRADIIPHILNSLCRRENSALSEPENTAKATDFWAKRGGNTSQTPESLSVNPE